MSLSAQQLAAQKNISWVLAEKLAQKILTGEYRRKVFFQAKWNWGNSLA